MVILTVHIRPKNGYFKANKIRKVTVDSSQRLEEIVEKEKGCLLYSNGREIPLNSSFASNNIQDGEILESCSSPIMSAVLSAVLQDLNSIEKIPEQERTEERVRPLLGNVTLMPWPNRWSHEKIKSRIICLAMMKKILQRDDRFANLQVPPISTLMELYNFIQPVLSSRGTRFRGGGGGGHNSMAHIFKPAASYRDGKPTICWELLQHKLFIAQQGRNDHRNSTINEGGPRNDWIEVFVRRENERHSAVETPATSVKRTSRSTPITRRKRILPIPSSTPRGRQQTKNIKCQTCPSMADCICLDPSCSFHQHFSCIACFVGNHPRHIRNHERVLVTDPRVKGVIKEKNKPAYCPEYASGPFAILSTLFEASEGRISRNQRPELSLSESRLKKIAQGRCRSNLYDRQARGRNAFACIENLTDKNLVRKELIPGQEEARFSLLPNGEAMAKLCFTFESALNDIMPKTNLEGPYNTQIVSLIVDSREDATYTNRLSEHCLDSGIFCDRRELPAGDYLFTLNGQNGGPEKVLPLVIERKSWSDLADSVSGAGKGYRRLDCIRVGGNGQCANGRCQLCRMKSSGCSKVMFIIEGARCLNRDEDKKCSHERRCKYCKELSERHGPNLMHEELEDVIYELQAKHGCLIHYTRGYNETIDSLLMIHRILSHQMQVLAGGNDLTRATQSSLGERIGEDYQHPLSYERFCSNARRSIDSVSFHTKKGKIGLLDAETFVKKIKEGKVREFFALQTDGHDSQASVANKSAQPVENLNEAFLVVQRHRDGLAKGAIDEIVISDDDDESTSNLSQESVVVLDNDEALDGQEKEGMKESIRNDNTSDNEIEVIEPCTTQQCHPIVDNDDVIVLDSGETVPGREKSNQTSLFVITGMYEYDLDFHHDINKIWQSLYRMHSSKSIREFRMLALRQLEPLQHESLPFVARASIHFWALKIQLSTNSMLHNARETICFESLEQYWLEQNVSRFRQRTIDCVAAASSSNMARRDLGDTPHSRKRKSLPLRVGLKNPPPAYELETINGFPQQLATPFSGSKRRALEPDTQKQQMTPSRGGLKTPPIYDVDPISGSNRKSTPQKRKKVSPGRGNTDASMREARLRRFEVSGTTKATSSKVVVDDSKNVWQCSSCTLMNQNDASECLACGAKMSWICVFCTFKNESTALKCELCGKFPSQSPHNKGPSQQNNSSNWTCQKCTFHNAIHDVICKMCKTPNPSVAASLNNQSRPRSELPPRSTQNQKLPNNDPSRGSRSRPVKCGACGGFGHNRGNGKLPSIYFKKSCTKNLNCSRLVATPQICPAYWNESEVKLRRDKKEKAEAKAKLAREEEELLERRKATSDTQRDSRMADLQRILIEQERDNEECRKIEEAELKRRRKAAERAERRARKLAERMG